MKSRVNVLVVHSDDDAWVGAKERLVQVFSEGLIRSFVVLPVRSPDESVTDPPVQVLRPGPNSFEWSDEFLLGHLAALGEVDHITVVGLNFTPAESEHATSRATSMNTEIERVRTLLVKFAGGIKRTEVRCALVAEGEKASGSPFLSPTADANIVILPRDVSMSRAVARPITRDNTELFSVHAALEISSLLGLWESMNMSPVDGIVARQLGQRGYEVRLFTSRVKGLLTPPLPIADLVDYSGELPLPNGYSSVDNPHVVIERFAATAFPKSLIFEQAQRPDDGIKRHWRALATAYVAEFGRMFTSIPSMLRHGFQGELDIVGSHALDRLLGGVEARVRPIIPTEEGGDDELISAEAVEEMIRDIEFREDRPLIEAMAPEQWDSLIGGVLGVADASSSADELRDSVMPSGFLVRDKSHLAPDVESVADYVTSVMPPEPRIAVHEPEAPSEPESGVGDETPGETSDDEVTESPEPIRFVATGEVDLMALREAVRRSGMSRPETPSPQESGASDLDVAGMRVQVDRADRTLLGRITSRFDAEFRKAEESVLESLTELRGMPAKFGSSSAGEVSRSVFFVIAIALGVIIVSLSTHDPLRRLMSFNWTTKRNRDFVWVAFSSMVVILSLASMPSVIRRNWQSRAMTTTAFCAAILAFEYLVFDTIRNRIISFTWGSSTALAATVILGGTTAICAVSIVRNSASEDPIRKRLARMLALTLWTYVVVGLGAFIAGPESFIVEWSDDTRHRLLVASQFLGWVCLLMATLVIVMVRVRQKNMFGVHQVTFNWAQENLVYAIDRRRLLRAAYTQWLMTSAVIARIFWHPLGREATEQMPFEGTLTGDESVLKFDLAGVELSEQGRIALLAKLKQMFVGVGWLRVQFDHARDEYQSVVAFITGDPVEQHDPVKCPSVPPVHDLLEGEANGDRFAFAKQLLSGNFDTRLLASATQGNLDAVYASILGDSRMHEVVHSQHPFETGSRFLTDIVPEERTKIPPRMLQTLRVPGDPSLLMEVDLWWPQTALLESPQQRHVKLHPSEVLRLERIDDSVVMVAVLTEMSNAFLNSDLLSVSDLDVRPTGTV